MINDGYAELSTTGLSGQKKVNGSSSSDIELHNFNRSVPFSIQTTSSRNGISSPIVKDSHDAGASNSTGHSLHSIRQAFVAGNATVAYPCSRSQPSSGILPNSAEVTQYDARTSEQEKVDNNSKQPFVEEGSSSQAGAKGSSSSLGVKDASERPAGGLLNEISAIKPGLAADVKFGGSGSFPNLPWVYTTGPGPNDTMQTRSRLSVLAMVPTCLQRTLFDTLMKSAIIMIIMTILLSPVNAQAPPSPKADSGIPQNFTIAIGVLSIILPIFVANRKLILGLDFSDQTRDFSGVDQMDQHRGRCILYLFQQYETNEEQQHLCRERDHHNSSRFNTGTTFRKIGKGNKEKEVLIENEAGECKSEERVLFHKHKHKILVSDFVFMNRWSNLSSSDLMFLNTEMLGAMSSNRFSSLDSESVCRSATRESEGKRTTQIKEEMEMKRSFERRISIAEKNSLVSISGIPSICDFNPSTSRTTNLNERRSVSDTTAFSRFGHFNENAIRDSSI
ncbi:unnamed protein product [Citrullus colocynthis]|uniref:Uncharacterized protein n=1 Tax=Citrullus colocynthis TaxID=252529 RepID=A0ABP0ZDJ5_9ROSI